MRILTVNAGSSSLKLALLEHEEQVGAHELPASGDGFDRGALRAALADLGNVDASGHRIVHGGESFDEPVLIDARVEKRLRALTQLAPLHQPKSLAALDAVRAELPDVPAVACFDTAFHATMPAAASTYALPASWRERFGVRKYGFHGLSHSYVARRVNELLGERGARARVVSAHLGAGASLCAIGDGRSLDTTMGFTPLDGLVMATRVGSVDPGALLWLLAREQSDVDPPLGTPAQMAEALEHSSGLLALAGNADMRAVLEQLADDPSARLALDVYVHRLRGSIAQMAAALGGLDALVFTGGIGEHSPEIRSRALVALGFLGLAIDESANRRAEGDCEIGDARTSARTFVVVAREDLEIARQVEHLLGTR